MCQQRASGSNGFAFDIFVDTRVEALAKAVDRQDSNAIDAIVSQDWSLLDFQEQKFGHTVLLVGAFNSKIVSVQKLLELGASPNMRSKHDSNPFLTVCWQATLTLLNI